MVPKVRVIEPLATAMQNAPAPEQLEAAAAVPGGMRASAPVATRAPVADARTTALAGLRRTLNITNVSSRLQGTLTLTRYPFVAKPEQYDAAGGPFSNLSGLQMPATVAADHGGGLRNSQIRTIEGGPTGSMPDASISAVAATSCSRKITRLHFSTWGCRSQDGPPCCRWGGRRQDQEYQPTTSMITSAGADTNMSIWPEPLRPETTMFGMTWPFDQLTLDVDGWVVPAGQAVR